MATSTVGNIANGFIQRLRKLTRNKYHKAGFSWPREIWLKHLPEEGVRTINFLGHPLSFNGTGNLLHSLQEIFLEDIYQQTLPDNAYIIDCGANIGLSIIYLKRLCPSASILAFEPDETNYRLLMQNIRSFEFSDVEARQAAVWTADTTLNFSNDGSLGSRITDEVSAKPVLVKAIRLREVLNRPVDFLKIDIEGAEYAVLMDVADQLRVARKVFIEYHGTYAQNGELNEILTLLVNKGFRYYIKEAGNAPAPFSRPVNPNGFDLQLNIFCTRID